MRNSRLRRHSCLLPGSIIYSLPVIAELEAQLDPAYMAKSGYSGSNSVSCLMSRSRGTDQNVHEPPYVNKLSRATKQVINGSRTLNESIACDFAKMSNATIIRATKPRHSVYMEKKSGCRNKSRRRPQFNLVLLGRKLYTCLIF